MKTTNRNHCICSVTLAVFLVATSSALWAQTDTKEMDMGDTDTTHESKDHSAPEPQQKSSGDMDHTKMDHGSMDHSKMDHSSMDHSKMGETNAPATEMDHADMAHDNTPGMQMDHGDMDHGDMPDMQNDDEDMSGMQMDHGGMDMKMQGGKAPADARDPHAYSGGFTLRQGPYSSAVSKQLHLADEHVFKSLLFNRLEYAVDNNTLTYDAQGWIGTTFDRLVVKAEGEVADGRLEGSETDILWGHAISTFWDTQAGVRLATNDEGESRQWLAFGVQGLAPYWFEVDITGYLGEQGRTALDVELEYELLITQRLVLQPRTEFSLYGDNDEVNGIGKGLSNIAIGVRLRYEFSRQFAPYIGVEWAGKFGQTADYAQALGEPESDTSFVAGLRFWF